MPPPIDPFVAYVNPLIHVNPGESDLFGLPQGMILHGAIVGDGACLFRSVSYAICDSQILYILYREKALEYISTHAGEFEEDILRIWNQTVEQYVNFMKPNSVFGDEIMVIALCLYLNVSIRLFQKGFLINSMNFIPTDGNATRLVNIYLDLEAYHYDCVLSAPLSDHLIAESSVEEFAKDFQEESNNFQRKKRINNDTIENDVEEFIVILKRTKNGISDSD